jgi:dihydropteroate synthase
MHTMPSSGPPRLLKAGSFTLTLERPLIMGVVNVTPDSFSDGGDFLDAGSAIAHAQRLVDEGADILDIGGESSRPGAASLPLEEELRRILPVLQACVPLGRPVSVDTCKPEVMRVAVEAGASMLNDIWGFRREGALEAAVAAAAGRGVALCVMHMQRDPATMQDDPHYDDVVAEVREFLARRVEALLQAGVLREQLVIDPGFGFGKSVAHNLALLRHLDRFATLGVPVLAGLSRKSTIGRITGRADPKDRVAGSIAAALLAAQNGATILRVHDVAATRDALAVWAAVANEKSQ